MPQLTQSLLAGRDNPTFIRYARRHASDAANTLLQDSPRCIGVAISQSSNGVRSFALATTKQIAVIDIPQTQTVLPKDDAFAALVSGTAGQPILAGFGMPRLAIHLQDALKLHVRGADLSTVVAKSAREPMYPSQVFRKKDFVRIDNFAVDRVWHESSQDEESEEERKLCLRSWLSAIAADAAFSEVERARKVDTRYLSAASLACFRLLLSQSDALEKSKPKEMISEFGEHRIEDNNRITLQNARYKTRIRRSNQAQVVMTNAAGEEFIGSAKGSTGKQASIKVVRGFKGVLTNVRIIGKDERNNAEKCREELILLSLQGDAHLPHAPFIELLWFPKAPHVQAACTDSIRVDGIPLNPSQQRVVAAMTCTSTCLMTTHGPPGTGKTSTIAASAKIWTEQRKPTWIVAHSNVAVKNIAEKLAATRVAFKLIVSKEFYVEWHEHLYHLIEKNTIRTDDLPERPQDVRRIFDECTIVLSTLSMLSNPAFDQNDLFSIVPVERLVVDEASQINIFEYMHLFWKFRAVLKMVSFFGDPKQLAPFGSDTTPSLQSIFQLRHFQKATFFLDVQYRMPTPLGDFISQAVYSNRLRSQHPIVSHSSVAFVDVRGQEEKSGFSWVNERELQTMITLVSNYYKSLDFCIITPYDAQRTAIENALKRSNLPWGKVFNIDSFQGNEADWVLVSLVRTENPGFLRSLNRMNVMLTRCRKGLVIVTNRPFLNGPGRHTLVAGLAHHWESQYGGAHWLSWNAVAEQKAVLPGVHGKFGASSGPHTQDASLRLPWAVSTPLPISSTRRRFDTKKLFAANWKCTPTPKSDDERPLARTTPQSYTTYIPPPAAVIDVARAKVQLPKPVIEDSAQTWAEVSVKRGAKAKHVLATGRGESQAVRGQNRFSVLRAQRV